MQQLWPGVILAAAAVLAGCSDRSDKAAEGAASGVPEAGASAPTPDTAPSDTSGGMAGTSSASSPASAEASGTGTGTGTGPTPAIMASASGTSTVTPDPVVPPEELAAAEKRAWLESPLYGGDNAMARARRVTISPKAGAAGYRVHIANQFSFECDLSFNSKGQPSRMSGCAPRLPENSEWKVAQKEIRLRCSTLATEVVCSGDYDLGMPAGDVYPGRMTIARRR